MPVRIYALAKELSVDSKELVEICKKAGIQGKGSALASLTDEEAQKVKDSLQGSKAPPAPVAEAEPSRPITREDYIAPTKAVGSKVQVLEVRPKRKAPLKRGGTTSPPEVDVEEMEEVVAEAVETEEVPSVVEPATEEERGEDERVEEVISPDPPEEPDAPVQPDPTFTPRQPGRVADLSQPAKDKGTKDKEKSSRKKRTRTPVIKLASMPEVKQPTTAAKRKEPVAQQPEMRLGKEAIAGGIRGDSKPLEAQMAKAEKKWQKKTVAEEPAPTPEKGGRGRREKGSQGSLADLASSRADRQKARRTRARQRQHGDDDDRRRGPRRPRTLTRRKGSNTAAPRKQKAILELPCTVRSFSEAAGVSSAEVIRTLMGLGQMCTINAPIDDQMVDLIAEELEVDLEIRQAESLEDALLTSLNEPDDEASLVPRPPVVTFLGHVDHGKTSLLDYLIGIDVVSGEAGGITQHIRAYQIHKNGQTISFVDTPGHEAFTEMRARGANVTDIAVLVVAADDGVMPQTEEAISHAKAAGVPIVVALNKIDLPGVDENKALQQLTQYELVPSEWGGDVEVVRTSAITGEGLDDLFETLLGIAELHELKANPDRPAVGVCLEAEQEPGRGVIAKFIVERGTLKVGDVIVCGAAVGRIKAMHDTLRSRVRVDEAGPTVPVNVTGLDIAPGAGDHFYVLDDIADARRIAEQREHETRTDSLAGVTTKVSFERFQELLEGGQLGQPGDVVTLNLILRADVRGSIEAIQKELGKLDHPEVQVKVLQASVGGITAADVTLADASDAVIVGFNVIPDDAARSLADERGVELRRYSIIYNVTDDIRAMLEGKLKPEERVVELGHAVVKQVFPISKVGTVAGCYVVQGSIERNCRIRVNRDGRTIGSYSVDTLRRVKDDVKEVPRGMECGIKLAGFNDIKKDDVLEAFKIEEIARTL